MSTTNATTPTAGNLWNVHDVAAYLKASTSYVYKAAERGQIPCHRLGALLRFVPDEVKAWAQGGPKTGARVLALPKDVCCVTKPSP
jgi:excisionase family DNA binding protein